MRILITNIKSLLLTEDNPSPKLAGTEMSSINLLENAYLISDQGIIQNYGSMKDLPEENFDLELNSAKFIQTKIYS